MVVFPPRAFGLTAAAAAQSLSNPRIGWQTYTRGAAASQVAVTSESPSGPKDAPLRPDTAEFWEPLALPANWQFDFGEIKSGVDYIGVVGSIGSSHCSVKAYTSLDALTWTAFSAETAPKDDAPILFLDTARQAKHVRLTFNGATPPRLSVVYAGTVLAMQRPLQGNASPVPMSRQRERKSAVTRGGAFLGLSMQRLGVKGSIDFKNLSDDWYRANFDPFAKAAGLYPFFWAWEPQRFPRDVAYVWLPDGSEIVPAYQTGTSLMQVGFPVQGIGWQ